MTHNHHHHEAESYLTFNEKILKMLEHWVRHNHEHAENYKKWAGKAKDNTGENVAVLLEAAADLTLSINEKLEEAAECVRKL